MWSSRGPLARFGLALAAAVLGLATTATGAVADPTGETTEPTAQTTPPPSGQEDAPVAKSMRDLDMTATFDKPSYATGEQMTITVTVTNTGAAPMTLRAEFYQSERDRIRIDQVNPFEQRQPFTLAGGASVTNTVTGAMGHPDLTTATLYTWLTDEATGTMRLFTFMTPVRQTRGHASGVVFYDRNRNREYDAGEGQRGVVLTWDNQLHEEETPRTVTTDANGGFRVADLPTGRYAVTGAGLGGLQVGWTTVTVPESGVDDLRFRGAAPLHGLVPTLEFTKDTYAPDEAPVVRVTLTNTSDLVLSGIVATCNRAGSSTSLNGTGEGWGALAGDGVDLAPRSTSVLEVTEPMPPRAHSAGMVTVGCEFGYPAVESAYNPASADTAAVPGMRNDLVGTVVHGKTGFAGVRLVLMPDLEFMPLARCAVIAETTTGADGTFAFRQVPVGIYLVYPYPPAGWQMEYAPGEPSRTDVSGEGESRMYMSVVPGNAAPPALPTCLTGGGTGPTTTTPPPATPTTTTRPAPQGARAPRLADTGVSILAPGVTGLLALLAGTGLVLAGRRRRTS